MQSATIDTGPVLMLSGELDYASADAVCDLAERMLSAADRQPLTVDMEAVTFIDAAGLAALVMLSNAAADAQTTIQLRRVPGRVARLLSITGLSELLAEEPTADTSKTETRAADRP